MQHVGRIRNLQPKQCLNYSRDVCLDSSKICVDISQDYRVLYKVVQRLSRSVNIAYRNAQILCVCSKDVHRTLQHECKHIQFNLSLCEFNVGMGRFDRCLNSETIWHISDRQFRCSGWKGRKSFGFEIVLSCASHFWPWPVYICCLTLTCHGHLTIVFAAL